MKHFQDDKSYFVIDMNWSDRLIIPLTQSASVEVLLSAKNLYRHGYSSEFKTTLSVSEESIAVAIKTGKELNDQIERGKLAAAAAIAAKADNDSSPLTEAAE